MEDVTEASSGNSVTPVLSGCTLAAYAPLRLSISASVPRDAYCHSRHSVKC